MTIETPSATQFFFQLTPEKVLEAVESLGVRCTGRVLALNSLENRVYEVELDIDLEPGAGRWDAYRVIKFYRPGRWTREQIQEEHRFLKECAAVEIPVVVPLEFPNGETIGEVADTGILYAIFPKVGGRILDEMSDSELMQIGRLLARLHNVGASGSFHHRMKLTTDTYGHANLAYLKDNKLVPQSVEGHYLGVAERIIRASEPWFRDEIAQRQRRTILEGYEMMRSFDHSSIRLIEPLRALRMIHFTTWIAKRYEDPAFKQIFVDYGSERYWREQLIALQEVGESLGIG